MWMPVPPTSDFTALGMVATATGTGSEPPQAPPTLSQPMRLADSVGCGSFWCQLVGGGRRSSELVPSHPSITERCSAGAQDAIRCIPKNWVRRVPAAELVWHSPDGSIWRTSHGLLVAAKGRAQPMVRAALPHPRGPLRHVFCWPLPRSHPYPHANACLQISRVLHAETTAVVAGKRADLELFQIGRLELSRMRWRHRHTSWTCVRYTVYSMPCAV